MEIFTATEFSYLTINKTNTKALYFVAGPSLTFGEGIAFTDNGAVLTSTTSDTIGVRLGGHNGKICSEYTQKSGTIGSIYGGNTKFAVDNPDDTTKSYSRINLSGDAKVLVRLEAGGNKLYVRNSYINISENAQVNDLHLGGYQANVGTSTVNITGGTIASITSARSTDTSSGKTVGNTSLTIGGTGKVGIIALNDRHSGGNNSLTISNDQSFNGDFGKHWDSISIDGNVELSGSYSGPQDGGLTVNGLLTLSSAIHDQELVDALNAANSGSGRVKLDNEVEIPVPSEPVTGYSNGNLGISNTTITGGYIAKIWGQRDSNNNKTNKLQDLNVTISGDTYFEEIDLGGIQITGTATLTIGNLADDRVFSMFDEHWDNIVIEDNVVMHLDGAYPIHSAAKLSVGVGSILYLDPESNTTVPEYTGAGKVVLDKHEGHELIHVAPFCGTEGRVEHWYCGKSTCSGYGNCYSDALCQTPMSKESTKTDGNHVLKELNPICVGHEYFRCDVCGLIFADEEAKTVVTEEEYVEATQHKAVYVAVKAPTCTEDGVIEAHWHCEACGWNFRDEAYTDLIKYSILDPKTGHKNLEHVEAKEASCTEDGCIEHYACADCDGTYTAATYGGSRLPLTENKVVIKARHERKHAEAWRRPKLPMALRSIGIAIQKAAPITA